MSNYYCNPRPFEGKFWQKYGGGGARGRGARVPPDLRACKLRKEDDNNKATLAANCDFKNVDSSTPS